MMYDLAMAFGYNGVKSVMVLGWADFFVAFIGTIIVVVALWLVLRWLDRQWF